MNITGYQIYGSGLKLVPNEFIAYNYIMAGNGIWLAAHNQYLNATIQIADCEVRGLQHWAQYFNINKGKLPRRLFDLALSVFLARPEIERYAAIVWDGSGYRLVIPDQWDADSSKVVYENPENVVLEMHSHCGKGPGFSAQDDDDELGFRIYGVVADLDEFKPSFEFRLGVYGYFSPLRWADVFEGELDGAIDINDRPKIEIENEDSDA